MKDHPSDCVCLDCLCYLKANDPIEHGRRASRFLDKTTRTVTNAMYDNMEHVNHIVPPILIPEWANDLEDIGTKEDSGSWATNSYSHLIDFISDLVDKTQEEEHARGIKFARDLEKIATDRAIRIAKEMMPLKPTVREHMDRSWQHIAREQEAVWFAFTKFIAKMQGYDENCAICQIERYPKEQTLYISPDLYELWKKRHAEHKPEVNL